MDFCSKYGLNYGFDGSDSEDISDEEEIVKDAGSKKVTKKVRKSDSNIIAVKFDELVSTQKMFAGEPIRCKSCEAIMSKISNANISEDGKTWKCEFCYNDNDISGYVREQVPTENDVTFLIEPPPPKQDANAGSSDSSAVKSIDENHIGYCIDISGSMDTKIPIKDDNQDQRRMNRLDGVNDANQNQRRMNRLDGVKIACLESIENLKNTEPNKRVALVTFSESIKYYGDSTRENFLWIGGNRNRNSEFEIAADIMTNKEKMIALAENQDHNLKPISESFNNLSSRIKSLKSENTTALGPALTFSIGLASHKPGAQVILCTDGCANVGMGSISGSNPVGAEEFYDDLADYAKSRGVTVNVITVEGTDCKIALLGKVADKSNGTISIVNPLNLSEQFKSILETRIVATSVRAKLFVNKYFYIRDENLESAELKAVENNDEAAKEALNKEKKSVIEKNVGNANVDTEITFEYGVRKLSEEEKKNAPELEKIVFQLQVYYVAPDGTKAVRVYTEEQELTSDRDKAESNMTNHEILFVNMAQKTSHYALHSNMACARYKEKSSNQMVQRRRLRLPDSIQHQSQTVRTLPTSTRTADLNDYHSAVLYSSKMASRSHMK